MSRTPFLIIGAGAIGGYLGVALANAGYPIAFLSRPNSASRLHSQGLTLVRKTGTLRLKNPLVYSSPEPALAEFNPAAIFVAVKSYHSSEVVEQLHRVRKLLPPILSLQNGVANEALLGEGLGYERILAGTVTTAVTRDALAGMLIEEKMRGVGIANSHKYPGQVEEIISALIAAKLNARRFENGRAMKWSKLITNLIANSLSALTGLTPAEIYSQPTLFTIEREILSEALRVMKAQGIPLVNVPGIPVRLLAAAIQLPPGLARPLLTRAIGAGRGGKMPSFYLELEAGNHKNEVSSLHDPVVLAGQKHGIATPANAFISRQLQRVFSGDLDRTTYRKHPAQLLSDLNQDV